MHIAHTDAKQTFFGNQLPQSTAIAFITHKTIYSTSQKCN